MKMIFYSTDDALMELAASFGASVCGDQDSLLAMLEEVDEDDKCVLFIDFDYEYKNTLKINDSLSGNDEWLIRIVVTETVKLKDLKKHQKTDAAAHGYVRKPLTGDIVQGILNDFELADFIAENELLEEGMVFEAPEPASAPAGMDVTGANFKPMSMSMASEVRNQVNAHRVGNSDEAPAWDNEDNWKIQAKFDSVFGKREKAKPVAEDLPAAPSIQNEQISGPSLDLGGGDLDIDLGDEPGYDATSSGTSIPEDLGGEEVSMDEDGGDDVGELDLGGDDVGELDLGGDDVGELDLGGDDEIEVEVEEEAPGYEMEAALDDDEEPFEDEPEPTMPSAVDLEMPDIGGGDDSAEELDLSEEETHEVDELDLSATDNPPTEEVSMSDDKSEELDGLAFDEESEAASEGDLEFGPSASGDDEEVVEDDNALDFAVGDGDDSGDDAGLDLGSDDAGGADLDLGGDDDAGELDLGGSDDSGELDLGGSDDSGELDLGGSDDSGELDLGGSDDSGELDLGGSDDSGELDLGGDETGTVEETLSNIVEETGEQKLEELEASGEVSELDLGEEEDDDAFDADELNLGVNDEEEDVDFGQSEEALIAAQDEDSIGEVTNPTMVMTDSLEPEGSLPEFRPGTETDVMTDGLDDEDELSFGAEEEEDEEEEDFLGGDDTDTDVDLGGSEEVITAASVDEEEEDDKTAVTEIMPKPAVANEEHIRITPQEDRVSLGYNENELLRLQSTIRQLREERDELLSEINELKTKNQLLEQENLGNRAELDDAKIEISIMKKRHADEIDEMKYRTRLAEEKKNISDEKYKKLQKEFDRLQNKVRIDFNTIKQREKELESKLELVTMDSETQVASRDKKILDLKRKIDQLEFNMENAAIKEQKSRDDKYKLEERLQKIMKTLRGSIELLEDDIEIDRELLNKLDKL